MLNFQKLNELIPIPDEHAAALAEKHWDEIAKPLNGLGQFERLITKIAALTHSPNVSIQKRAVIVFCADNGVVAEGVTQTDASVTATMAAQIRDHRSSVCLMAASAHAEVFAVDMGMYSRVDGICGCHIADGTNNIAMGPAMTQAQALRAISYGIRLAKNYSLQGYELLATGEMGIGNTTTSSALASVLLQMPVETVTGRGAGLSDDALKHKCDVIHLAIKNNAPIASDPLDVLTKLGGFDIAGMVGLFLGGALYHIPVLVDGLISAVAALIAARLCPNSCSAMIPSHSSAEPAAAKILSELELHPILYADMKLGEGTGAVCMIPLLDMALAVYHHSTAFAETDIPPYQKLGGEDS